MKDIVQKKSLKEILPKNGKMPALESEEEQTIPPAKRMTEEKMVRNTLRYQEKSYKSVSYFFWTTSVVIVLVIFYLVSSFYASASINLEPKQVKVDTTGSYQASPEPTENPMGYSVISGITEKESRTLPASGVEKSEIKATGRVIIYNNYNTSAQELVVNTRLESPDGKIYRIKNAVNVPGLTKKNGDTIPGSVEVDVVADQPGPSYNKERADFTIPGFKGGARYEGFYARTKTAITGGSSGNVAKISDADRSKAVAEMQASIKTKLLTEAGQQIPKGFILLDESSTINFEDVARSGKNESEAVLEVTGKLTAALFDTNKLARYFAEKKVPDFGGEDISIANVDKLKITLKSNEDITGANPGDISFDMTGEAVLSWPIDEKGLKDRLLGKSSKESQAIFSSETNLKRAEVTFRPPWISKFSNNPEKIKFNLILNN